jgi:uncharacterized protein YegP (UPF0339 family)
MSRILNSGEAGRPMAKRIVFQRIDRRWGWELKADNGQIIATDGSQGYENETVARAMADRIIGGEFRDAEKLRRPLKD